MVFIDIKKKKKTATFKTIPRSKSECFDWIEWFVFGSSKKKQRHFAKQVSFYIGRADQILNSMRFRSEVF